MFQRISRFLAVIILILLLATPCAALAQSDQRCFSETGYCIAGRIRQFWEANGGLPVFGLPITPQQQETIEGQSLQVQWFERNRLELHPENARPNDVLLGRLGADLLAKQGRDWQSFPKSSAQGGCRFSPETGHNVCGAILAAWRKSGLEQDGRSGKSEAENLALWGLPLSDLQNETLSDGQQYQVQWFERGRFELHPENQPPYNVLLGLLGKELGPTASAAPGASGQCAAVTQIDPNSAEGRKIVADLLSTLEPGTQPTYVSIMDQQDGWVIFTFESTTYERGYMLMHLGPDGKYQVVTVWGGIADDIAAAARAWFIKQAPDVPRTLVSCWSPRYPGA